MKSSSSISAAYNVVAANGVSHSAIMALVSVKYGSGDKLALAQALIRHGHHERLITASASK